MGRSRKQIAFDIDTAMLKVYYPSKSWNNAYEDIKRYMKSKGFEWKQGSVYISRSPLPEQAVAKIMKELANKHTWLNMCMRDCTVSSIGRTFNLNYIFNKDLAKQEVLEKNIDNKKEEKEKKNIKSERVSIFDTMKKIESIKSEKANTNRNESLKKDKNKSNKER